MRTIWPAPISARYGWPAGCRCRVAALATSRRLSRREAVAAQAGEGKAVGVAVCMVFMVFSWGGVAPSAACKHIAVVHCARALRAPVAAKVLGRGRPRAPGGDAQRAWRVVRARVERMGRAGQGGDQVDVASELHRVPQNPAPGIEVEPAFVV